MRKERKGRTKIVNYRLEIPPKCFRPITRANKQRKQNKPRWKKLVCNIFTSIFGCAGIAPLQMVTCPNQCCRNIYDDELLHIENVHFTRVSPLALREPQSMLLPIYKCDGMAVGTSQSPISDSDLILTNQQMRIRTYDERV